MYTSLWEFVSILHYTVIQMTSQLPTLRRNNHLQNVSFTSLFHDLLAHSSLQTGFTFISSEQVCPSFLFCTPSFATFPSCVEVIDYLKREDKSRQGCREMVFLGRNCLFALFSHRKSDLLFHRWILCMS